MKMVGNDWENSLNGPNSLLLLLLPRMPKACGGPVRYPKVAVREVAGEEEDWVEPERKTLGERLGIPLLLLGSPKGRAKRVE